MKKILPILLLFVLVFTTSCKQESLEEKIQKNIHKGFLDIVTDGLETDFSDVELQKTEIMQIDTINVDNFSYKKRMLEDGNLFFILNAKHISLDERIKSYNSILNDTITNKKSPVLGYVVIAKATLILNESIEESSYAPIIINKNHNIVKEIDELKE